MERTFAVSSTVSQRVVDDTVILMDARTTEYFALNRTGADIWRALVEGRSLALLLDGLTERYGHARTAAALAVDVGELVDELLVRGLIYETTP